MQKAEKYIKRIIEADKEEQAIDIIMEIAKDLGIDKRYSSLIATKDLLDEYKKAFKETRSKVMRVDVPDIKLLQEVRGEAAFAYSSLVDDCGNTVNAAKIEFGDDKRKEIKGKAYIDLMNDEEFKEKAGVKTATAIKDLVGTHQSYTEWLNCSKVAYANWATYRDMLEGWKLFIDYLASAIRHEEQIRNIDHK